MTTDTQEQWDIHSEAYEAFFENDAKLVSTTVVFPRILAFLGELKSKSVLDFGCGQGRFCRYFYDAGAEVVGFDPAASELAIAHKLDQGRDIIYTSQLNSIAHSAFDVVLCFMVLLCNPLPAARVVLTDIYKRTQSGGRAVFVCLNTEALGTKFPDHYSEKPNPATIGTPYKTFIPTSKGLIEVTDHYYSPTDLRELFQQAGFNVLHEEVIQEQFILHILTKA